MISQAMSDKVAKALKVPARDNLLAVEETAAKDCENCSDLKSLIQELKDKCLTSTNRERVRLLTMAPTSWSIEKVATEFNVTLYLAKKARKLYKSSGILADPAKAQGKTLSQVTVDAVKEFYEDDEFSRMCPGKKDFVSVKEGTGRVHKQKRLLLTNLKEMHIEFKKRTNLKVGLSKFCELRPKWCVTVDSSGMHSVCVCQTHQNLKLLISALPQRIDMKDVFLKTVCSLESRECMLHRYRCINCMGRSNLENYIKSMFADDQTDVTTMSFTTSSGFMTAQLKLQAMSSSVSEFSDALCEAVDVATGHHFTCKAQSLYLRQLKESLQPTSAIILLDFAENYSFVCQDATQGFHWNTDQATYIHLQFTIAQQLMRT